MKRQFEEKNFRSAQISSATLAMPSTKMLRAKDKSTPFLKSQYEVVKTEKSQHQVNIRTMQLN